MRLRPVRPVLARVACCVLVLLVSAQASAEESRRSELAWTPAWPKFRPAEYVVTGVAGVASIGAFFLLSPPSRPHWTGGILFDDSARDAIRLRSPGARDRARTWSNVTAVSATALVLVVDSLAVPVLRHRPDVATQLVLMDAESFAISTLITNSLFNTVGRARPSYEDCQRNPSFDPLCRSGTTTSFPSGHTNGAFTAAGLSCAHHLHLALYDSPLADTAACVGEIALAGATGTLRMAGDRHYASDVWTAALVGFSLGYGMPTLLHYGKVGKGTELSLSVQPVDGGLAGAAVAGTF